MDSMNFWRRIVRLVLSVVLNSVFNNNNNNKNIICFITTAKIRGTYFISNFKHLLKVFGHVCQLGLQRVYDVTGMFLHVFTLMTLIGFYKLFGKDNKCC